MLAVCDNDRPIYCLAKGQSPSCDTNERNETACAFGSDCKQSLESRYFTICLDTNTPCSGNAARWNKGCSGPKTYGIDCGPLKLKRNAPLREILHELTHNCGKLCPASQLGIDILPFEQATQALACCVQKQIEMGQGR